MPPDRSAFTALNLPQSAVPQWMGAFSITAAPSTDLWRKPPCLNIITAPILYTALRFPFVSAEVTVSADWECEWDQGGLVIFSGPPSSGISSTAPPPAGAGADALPPYSTAVPAAAKWVRVGLEYRNNVLLATSVCATADGADWTMTMLAAHRQRRTDLRVKMERIGYALWVWFEDELAGWQKIREVTWFFWGVEDKSVRVGAYASRPVRNGAPGTGRRDLCVSFEGLEIF